MESDRRFGFIILLFRLAGIPFHISKMSIIYAIYMRTVIICTVTSYLGMFVDVYVHSDDLGRAMTTMRVLIPLTNIMWLYTYCRWVRKRTITVYSKTSSYQTQHYGFSNVKIQHKCLAEDKQRKRSLFHIVIICFRLGSV